MPKKALRPPRVARLQRVVSEVVTDPAEIAAAEKVYKRLKRLQRKQEAKENGESVKKSPKTKTNQRRSSEPRS